MKYAPIIIIQSIITFQVAAMDARELRNRQIHVARLKQHIQDKEHQIRQGRIIRYAVEFSTPFLAHTIDQPYAAGITVIGIAAVCLLTNDIEDATETRDVLKKNLSDV